MSNLSPETIRHAQVLWEYLHLDIPLQKADIILAMGSHELRVAEKAAELYHQGFAPLIVISGGLGKQTKGHFKKTEAEVFADIAIKADVPEESILLEMEATNSGDNFIKTRKLLLQKDIEVQSAIIVTKPYMRRRAYAIAMQRWPEVKWSVTSPDFSLTDYTPEMQVTNIQIMVGDLQRMKVYAEAPYHFQIPQEIPDTVWQSYEWLCNQGFNQHVIQD